MNAGGFAVIDPVARRPERMVGAPLFRASLPFDFNSAIFAPELIGDKQIIGRTSSLPASKWSLETLSRVKPGTEWYT